MPRGRTATTAYRWSSPAPDLEPRARYPLLRMAEHHGSIAAISRLLAEVESLLKQPSVQMELGKRGINASIALVAAQGLTLYMEGNRVRAHEDFATAAEEIRARLEMPPSR